MTQEQDTSDRVTSGSESAGVTGKPIFSPFTPLQRVFAVYWKPIGGVLAILPALLLILKKLGLPVSFWTDEHINPLTQWSLIGLGLVVLIVIRVPRIAYVITKWIVGPPPPLPPGPRVFRGPLPYGAEDAQSFFGRTADIETCWDRIRRAPFFILEGESGCGKSSLLAAALLPKARSEFRVIECRCAGDPFGKLRSALLGESYQGPKGGGKAALNEALELIGQQQSKPPLLICIDQFEELFTTVKDTVRQSFIDTLKKALAEGRFRLLISIRKDYSDLLLDACREIDPDHQTFVFDRNSYYTLRSFQADHAVLALNQMLDRYALHGGDPLRRQQLQDFTNALVRELLRPPLDRQLSPEDEPRVLPVELQMVGWTYESLVEGNFSAADLQRHGGKAGLYRDYIYDAEDYVFRKTGVPAKTSLLVLRRLISPARTKHPQSVDEIAGSNVGLRAELIDHVLQAFAERYLVRRLPEEVSAGPQSTVGYHRYELMHEHLIRLLAEAAAPVVQRARDAEERLDFWRSRTEAVEKATPSGVMSSGSWLRSFWVHLTSAFSQPVPIGETIRVWRYARSPSERTLLRGSVRGFACRAAGAIVLVAAVASVGYVARESWIRTDRYQIARLIEEAPHIKVGLGNYGVRGWADALALSGRTDDALRFVRGLVKEDDKSLAFAAIAKRLAQRGDPDRGYEVIQEALVAARQSPENVAMESYTSIVDATQALTARGKSDLATQVLDTIRQTDLAKVPRGNNRCAVADVIADAYIAVGKPKLALQTVHHVVTEATDSWSSIRLARKLSKLGDKEAAHKLLVQAEQQADTEDAASQLLSIANAYRVLEMPKKQKAMVSAAINAARKMKGRKVHNISRDTSHIGYFRFSHDAASFAEQLVRSSGGEEVGEFVKREGDPLTRIEILSTVARAVAKGNALESGRYMDEAQQEAEKLTSDGLRAEALTKLARAAAYLNDGNRAGRLLDAALEAARKLPEEYVSDKRLDYAADKTARLAEIAVMLADIRTTSDAVPVAHEAERASWHIAGDPSYYLTGVCEALARSGDHVLACQTAKRAADGDNKLLNFAAVLREITRKQDTEVDRLMREERRIVRLSDDE